MTLAIFKGKKDFLFAHMYTAFACGVIMALTTSVGLAHQQTDKVVPTYVLIMLLSPFVIVKWTLILAAIQSGVRLGASWTVLVLSMFAGGYTLGTFLPLNGVSRFVVVFTLLQPAILILRVRAAFFLGILTEGLMVGFIGGSIAIGEWGVVWQLLLFLLLMVLAVHVDVDPSPARVAERQRAQSS
ncbi:hypothetical protein HYV72_01825 [Candidatus Uhrbacteria bacterium]|nr:hypothetical protein [Candidatus Uhrbacteria bacterium]